MGGHGWRRGRQAGGGGWVLKPAAGTAQTLRGCRQGCDAAARLRVLPARQAGLASLPPGLEQPSSSTLACSFAGLAACCLGWGRPLRISFCLRAARVGAILRATCSPASVAGGANISPSRRPGPGLRTDCRRVHACKHAGLASGAALAALLCRIWGCGHSCPLPPWRLFSHRTANRQDAPSPLLRSATRPAVVCQVDFALSSAASRAQLPALPAELQPPRVPRRVTCEAGSILGELDFFLQRPRRWGVAVVLPTGSSDSVQAG